MADPDHARLISEVAKALEGLFQRQRDHVSRVVDEHELTHAQAALLRAVEHEGCAMSRLAEVLSCDASNVTGLVVRLEVRGLLKRKAAPHDRRIKLLAPTPEGLALRERLKRELGVPLPGLVHMSDDELGSLRDLLRKALGQE